ncbi:hypothetical protein GWK47_014424 [Chionoecetes opilio]|uniref:Uncharacterized protein n=1 Tax=Chionoecetes opilio TaxID=41210 RepID=A0A8J4XX24_CHIOP|nr:hypothetical protein GWK47_014424 [Chionoecetes opilio]
MPFTYSCTHHPGRSTRYSYSSHHHGNGTVYCNNNPSDEDPDLHDDSSPPFIATPSQRPRPLKSAQQDAAPVTSDRGSASQNHMLTSIQSTIEWTFTPAVLPLSGKCPTGLLYPRGGLLGRNAS